ncbi:MAG: MaoC family dehydratase N-terminal domain-containing protein [Actinomycetota bacterium]
MNSVLDLAGSVQRFVGRPAGPPRTAPFSVDRSAIANWCAALGDALPVYTDEAFAARSRWGGIIAPPTMLQTWTFPDRRTTPAPEPGPDEAEAELLAELRAQGYDRTVATDSEQTYLDAVRPGDLIGSRTTIAGITGPKRTWIGEGFFVTLETEYVRQDGTVVGTQRFRSFRYRAAEQRTAKSGPAPAVVGGSELPVLEIPMTPTLIVASSVASGDFNGLHHDRDFAQAAGAADIFLNILSTNGLVGRYVGEWAGPDVRFLRVALRLGVPNYAYDTLRLAGVVERQGATTTLRVDGTNSLGSCVTATVEVELP